MKNHFLRCQARATPEAKAADKAAEDAHRAAAVAATERSDSLVNVSSQL